jgi:hypothetical protein
MRASVIFALPSIRGFFFAKIVLKQDEAGNSRQEGVGNINKKLGERDES